jgi:hypothetical protein
MSSEHRFPSSYNFANMDQYYKTKFETYQNVGQEMIYGGFANKSDYKANTENPNYAKISDLYKGEAAFYSATCKK